MEHIIYECGICGGCHPWEWDGDCRDDANRYADEQDYAERNAIDERDVVVLGMEDRVKQDMGG